jgi:hypothetical protein
MSLNNKILNDSEQKIEASLTPENRNNYMKIVVAGMKVAMQGGPNSILASLCNKPVLDAEKTFSRDDATKSYGARRNDFDASRSRLRR